MYSNLEIIKIDQFVFGLDFRVSAPPPTKGHTEDILQIILKPFLNDQTTLET